MRLRYSPNMTIFNHLLRLGMFLNHGSFWDHTPDHDRSVSGCQAWMAAGCSCAGLLQAIAW